MEKSRQQMGNGMPWKQTWKQQSLVDDNGGGSGNGNGVRYFAMELEMVLAIFYCDATYARMLKIYSTR